MNTSDMCYNSKQNRSIFVYEYFYINKKMNKYRELWLEESVANSVNEKHFAKLKSAKHFYPVQIC